MFGRSWISAWEELDKCLGGAGYVLGRSWISVWEELDKCLGGAEFLLISYYWVANQLGTRRE